MYLFIYRKKKLKIPTKWFFHLNLFKYRSTCIILLSKRWQLLLFLKRIRRHLWPSILSFWQWARLRESMLDHVFFDVIKWILIEGVILGSFVGGRVSLLGLGWFIGSWRLLAHSGDANSQSIAFKCLFNQNNNVSLAKKGLLWYQINPAF